MKTSRIQNLSYTVFLLLLLAVTLPPLFSNRLPDHAMTLEWTCRLQELTDGFTARRPVLFPQAEVFDWTGVYDHAMNSNLWLFVPAVLYFFTGNLLLSYQTFLFLIQVGTLLSSDMFFSTFFSEKEPEAKVRFIPKHPAALCGIALYMTCPYRLFLCYDQSNLFEALVWMLLPLYVWALSGFFKNKRQFPVMCFAGFLLTLIGYTHLILYLVILCFSCLAGLLLRNWKILISLGFSILLSLPCLYRLVSYLFDLSGTVLILPLNGIMKNGYFVGQFFSSYAYQTNHPGMGLGLLLCLFGGLWLSFVASTHPKHKWYVPSFMLFGFLTLLSLSLFPWDPAQRLGLPVLKFISRIGTPGLFWGLATAVFTLPAALISELFCCRKNRTAALLFPLFVLLLSMGIGLHLCSTLIS